MRNSGQKSHDYEISVKLLHRNYRPTLTDEYIGDQYLYIVIKSQSIDVTL